MKFKTEEEKKSEMNRLLMIHTEGKNKLGIKQGSFKWIVLGIEEAMILRKKLDIKFGRNNLFGFRGYPFFDGIEISTWNTLWAFLFVKIKHIFQ